MFPFSLDMLDVAFDMADVALRIGPVAKALLNKQVPSAEQIKSVKTAMQGLSEELKTDADETFFDLVHGKLREKFPDLAENIDHLFADGTGFSAGEREALTAATYTLYCLKDKKPEGQEACVDFLAVLAREETVAGMRAWLKKRKYFEKLAKKEKREASIAEVRMKFETWGTQLKTDAPELGKKLLMPAHEALCQIDDLVTRPGVGGGPSLLERARAWSEE